MREHGDNSVRVLGSVVHNFPSSNFNTSGITRSIDSVERAAAPLERWVYYVHPAGHGCVGIAVHASTDLLVEIARQVTADLTIPCRFSESPEELDAFVRDLLR